jgi:glycosyltransferase involved in cell wall biosynthesis
MTNKTHSKQIVVNQQYSKFAHPVTEPNKFSIIIPTWNNFAMLRLCIDSIRKNSAFKHQIIVHVNDGSDGTLEWVRSQADIDYTYTPENIGICYAMNLACSMAVTDYIVYINDDMYVCPAWDKPFDTAIAEVGHPFFFFSGVLVEPTSSATNFGTCPDNFDEQKFLDYYAAMSKQNHMGACNPPNIVHRDMWNLVGGYSIEFSPGFASDPDFVAKLWKFGVRHFREIGGSVVYHFYRASTSRIRQRTALARALPRSVLTIKWGFQQGVLGKFYLHCGLPVTPQNEALPVGIPFKKRIILKFKYLHCVLLSVFSKEDKMNRHLPS